MVALDLDSQIQLLSRIQFLTRFSSNLVQVTGDSGSGKTWLSERYLENWATEPVQSLLLCNSNQQDLQHRSIILRQIVRDAVFNENDPLLQSLDQILQGQGVHALIVIDDAQRLMPALLEELWALVDEAQRRDDWQINVLLFGLRGKLTKCLNKISLGQGIKPLELEISPLTENERDMFIDVLMVSKKMDAASRRVLKQKVLSLPLLPGALRGLESQEISSMDDKKSRTPIILGVLTFFLLIVGTGLIWLTVFPSTPEEPLVRLPVAPGLPLNPNNSSDDLSNLNNSSNPDNPLIPSESTDSKAFSFDDPTALDDTSSFSEPPDLDGMTVGRSNKNRREVILSEDVVDAIIENQKKTENTAQNPSSDPISVSQALLLKEDNLLLETVSKMSDHLDVPLANQILLAVPRSHYGLQLAALESKREVNAFIKKYDLNEKVFVYETRREGNPWFIVLFDQYPSVSGAREAQSSLSKSLKNLSPWPKSFVRIHDEINLLN